MNRADRARLDDLRDRAELADLEIDTMSPDEFKTLDASKLTAGQIVKLADLVNAFRIIRDFQGVELSASKDYPSDVYATPATSERRSGPFSGASFGAQSDDDTDEADQARLDEVRERVLKLLSGGYQDQRPVQTVNGPIAYSDLPRDDNGNIPKEWIDENCTCDDHEQKRIERDRSSAAVDPFSFPPGQYL